MWSIGIYDGKSPFHLAAADAVNNPVLTRQHVSDVPAKFVADPFMVRVDGVWHMFFEVMNEETNKGEIGLAVSRNARDWDYQRIVLTEPFHLSYPYVFEWNGEHYMIPETLQAGCVSLYKAQVFPTRWSYVGSLIPGPCADPSIFEFAGKWWMFVCSTPYEHDVLRLYFATELLGTWSEHPASPIVAGDKRRARPAGRVLVWNDKIVRFSQDCIPEYGTQVRAFEISDLTTRRYVEAEEMNSPILAGSGNGWNAIGMHHVDPHWLPDGRWIACVDGSSGA